MFVGNSIVRKTDRALIRDDVVDCFPGAKYYRFLMAKDLNGYFSPVFNKEYISSIPVPDTKFQGAISE